MIVATPRARSPARSPPASADVGTSSVTVPSASTPCTAAIRPRTAPCRRNRLPDALRPIMPPTVVTALLDGSGPNIRPNRPRCRSSCASTTPGCTRTVPAARSVWTIRRRNREQSMTIPGPSGPPQTLEPAPRACTETPRLAAQRIVAATSSTDRGRTTASGSTSNRLPSVAYRLRRASSQSTSPDTTPRRSSSIRLRSASMRRPRLSVRALARPVAPSPVPSPGPAPAGAFRAFPDRSRRDHRSRRRPGSGRRSGSR